MRHLARAVMPVLFLAAARVPAAQAPPQRITLSVRDADWKDVLKAALAETDLNLSFDADLDGRVQGLDLKGVTLQELLDEILPGYGLGYVRTGRSLHIVKSDGGLRFYQVDSLALRRVGSKAFSVNASGQTIQTGSSSGGGQSSGGSGQGGNSSAYLSSLTTGNGADPWAELQVGLRTLIFGDAPPAAQSAQDGAGAAGQGGPVSSAYHQGAKSLIINPGSGVVAVAADAGTQRKVVRFLDEMQRRNRRQVLLEARIVEVTLDRNSQMGVDWSSMLSPQGASPVISSAFTPGATNNAAVGAAQGLFTLSVANARISATLSALARDQKLKVLSSPRLTALNNQKAILRVVREQAYFLSTSQTSGAGSLAGATTTVNVTPVVVPVGIVLDIQPQIGDDGSITLAVNPSVSEVADVASFSTTGASASLPEVDRRDLDTVVRIQSGETLVLAGIIKTSESADNRGVPWLSRVPVLGALFRKDEKSRTRTELAIFITPTLMEDHGQIERQRQDAEQRLKDAGASPAPPGQDVRPLAEP